jgi:hypothetical protein
MSSRIEERGIFRRIVLEPVFEGPAVLRGQIEFRQSHFLSRQRRVNDARFVKVLRIERHAARRTSGGADSITWLSAWRRLLALNSITLFRIV